MASPHKLVRCKVILSRTDSVDRIFTAETKRIDTRALRLKHKSKNHNKYIHFSFIECQIDPIKPRLQDHRDK
jgi:hypothetical protein